MAVVSVGWQPFFFAVPRCTAKYVMEFYCSNDEFMYDKGKPLL